MIEFFVGCSECKTVYCSVNSCLEVLSKYTFVSFTIWMDQVLKNQLDFSFQKVFPSFKNFLIKVDWKSQQHLVAEVKEDLLF